MEDISFGALESKIDPRTVKNEEVAMVDPTVLVKGGSEYLASEIEHQHKVGICTSIHLTQNRQRANGTSYSADFQYLLQKKYYDLNWIEGSSIFSALKVAKNIGFLPLSKWTYTTENDRYLPYSEYIKKLQAIPDSEIERLKSLCVDKIPGYASVNVNDPQLIAKAIVESESGILCRYDCGDTWWLPSWAEKDISPLRKPVPATSGHAIIMSNFDYTNTNLQTLANTWGTSWARNGSVDINHNNYRMTEAWTILKFTPEIKFKFTRTLKFGMRGEDVKELQRRLGVPMITGFFGLLTKQAVKNYQYTNLLVEDGIVGKFTRDILNK